MLLASEEEEQSGSSERASENTSRAVKSGIQVFAELLNDTGRQHICHMVLTM